MQLIGVIVATASAPPVAIFDDALAKPGALVAHQYSEETLRGVAESNRATAILDFGVEKVILNESMHGTDRVKT